MPQISPEQTRHPRRKHGHCKRRKMPMPKDILAATTGVPALSDDGRILAVPTRSGVAVLDLDAENEGCAATEVDLPAAVVQVVIAPDGLIFALCKETDGVFTVHRLRGTETQCVLSLDLPVRDLVATRKTLVLSTAAKGLEPARLLVFGRNTGKIRSRERWLGRQGCGAASATRYSLCNLGRVRYADSMWHTRRPDATRRVMIHRASHRTATPNIRRGASRAVVVAGKTLIRPRVTTANQCRRAAPGFRPIPAFRATMVTSTIASSMCA